MINRQDISPLIFFIVVLMLSISSIINSYSIARTATELTDLQKQTEELREK